MRGVWIVYIIGFLVLAGGTWLLVNRSDAESATVQNTEQNVPASFALTTSAFVQGGSIPSIYTCDADEAVVPLSVAGVPEGTETLALIMEDRDIPKRFAADGVFVHWVQFNIPPNIATITEAVGTKGANGMSREGYMGPCPPPQYDPAEHRYYFTLYALDTVIPLEAGVGKEKLLKEMEGHVIAQTELMARYKRQ